MISKTELNKLVRAGKARETFIHSTAGEFDVTAMRLIAEFAYEKFSSDLHHELVDQIKRTRDWDQERINNLTIEEAIIPTLWVHDNSDHPHILIDGTHRLIAGFERFKFKIFRGYMARLDQVIRPDFENMAHRPEHDWGRIVVKDGILYDRATGRKIP